MLIYLQVHLLMGLQHHLPFFFFLITNKNHLNWEEHKNGVIFQQVYVFMVQTVKCQTC